MSIRSVNLIKIDVPYNNVRLHSTSFAHYINKKLISFD